MSHPTRQHSPYEDDLSPDAINTWPSAWGDMLDQEDRNESPLPSRSTRKSRHILRFIVIAVILFPFVWVVGVAAAIYREARSDEARPVDAIIILGAAQYNGRPTRVFEARLEHGLDLYEQGFAPWIIVTGGRMEGDAFTEAETAETWLINRGVPAGDILMENQGRDTWQNIRGAWQAAEPHNIRNVLIVSDGFHLFRAKRFAEAVGFHAWSSPVPDSPIRRNSASEFAYIIRETAAVILQAPKWLF